MSKTKATFQPTVRPDWLGAMDYIPTEEQVKIFQAILAFPSIDLPESSFWNKTIKPDLQQQLDNFLRFCDQRKIAARNRWDNNISENKELDASGCTCIPRVCTVKEKEKEKKEEKVEDNTGGCGGIFIPPTEDEVLEYARSQNEMAGCGGFKCDERTAKDFWSYYDQIGWVAGKHEHPIRNWQSSLKHWVLRNERNPNKPETDSSAKLGII